PQRGQWHTDVLHQRRALRRPMGLHGSRLRDRGFNPCWRRKETVMSASTATTTSSASQTSARAFWERLWRMSGINFVSLFVVGYLIHGSQPHIGAPADALVAFYDGHHTRILIAAVFSGMAVLNLMWFAAALRTVLADAGQDGWGAAATAASSAVGAL